MVKTLTLSGLTSVRIKQSAFDMARFCWVKNRSEGDIFISCTDTECTENADNVMKISAGEYGMLDSESYETLYLNGSGTVEIITTAFLVCPFDRGGKGGGSSGGMKLIGSYAVTYGDTTSTGFVPSEEIELPIDLYENNRTLLIRMTINDGSSTNYYLHQNYSMIKIEIPYDIYDTGKRQFIYSPFFSLRESSSSDAHFALYCHPKTNKFSIQTYIKSPSGEISLDVYDMGVIE